MMIHATLCSLIVLTVPALVQCISVVGPRVLRPFSPYSVAIASGARAHTLYVAVEGRRDTGEPFSQGRQVQVPPATSRQVEFDIGDPGPGEYSLVARSTAGPLFSSAARLAYQPRSYCVFVQTDKRVYQPGDTINFAVVALDKHLLPLSNEVDVSVLDSGGSPVWQKLAVTLDKGIFTDQFILADEPALGEWTIQVEVRGQTYSKQIRVADYVMPKFQMDIELPKEALFTEGRFTVDVTAKHFNGQPVNGELTISAYAVFFSQLLQPVFSPPARKVIAFDGHAEVVYDFKTDLDLNVDAARPVVVEAVLEERDTLIRQNVSTRILLMRTPYRLKVTAPDYFKPTLPYNVQIEVVNSSGHIIDVNEEVTIERLWDDGAPVNVTSVALKKGIATYTLVPDAAHSNSTLNIVIKYKDVTERLVNVQRNSDSGGQFLLVELLTRDTAVGDEMRARITATEPMDLVHYVIIGRGDILVAKTLELNPPRKSVDISAEVSRAMTPGSVLLAWYPRPDSADTVLAAALYAPHRDLLQHKVSLKTVSESNYQPNTLTDLQVTGEAGSRVVVLGMDVNAIAAGLAGADGRGSGLDLHTIQREVESFLGLKHSVFKNEEHLPGLGLDIAGYTSRDVFKKAGVVILTDGVVASGNGVDPIHEEPESGTRPPLAGPYAFSRLPPPPSPRYYLTVNPLPTWAFANFSLDNVGRGSAGRWTPPPHVPVELTVGAFAVDSQLGLGLAAPRNLATSVPLSINVELPNTMQKGETVAAVVVLKSTLTEDISVEVTMYNTGQKFEFELLDNDINSKKKIDTFGRLQVTVPARGTASTAFLVTLVQAGPAEVLVDAKATGVSASFSKTIDVTDGYQEDVWVWSLLDARSGVARANMTLEPVAGTRLGPVSLVATGDLLASALQALWQAPPAAGDPPHAVRPLAVACVLLDYLQTTNQEKESWTKAARDLASVGFQRLMAYRRSDGSFAPETDKDSKGDVWMTAVSLRWVSRCARHVSVSPAAAAGAAEWLARAQGPDGAWPAASAPHNDPRAQAALPLAAHALKALIQAKGKDIHYKNAINKAVDYLAKGLSPSLDAYTLAVVGNALAAAKHPEASVTLQYMDKYVNNTGSTLFWSRRLTGSEWRNPWLRSNSFEAHTAALGLGTMLAARLVDQAEPVARFLLQAYRPDDPDPDVLDALAHYAELIRTSTKLRISVNVTGSPEPKLFQIGDNNPLIIQDQLINEARSATAVSEGRGLALAGLRARGATRVTAAWPRYTLDPRVDQVSTKHRMQLSICVGYVPHGNETESGLTLLTVQLPTGYTADINTITELTASRMVSSARVLAGGARVAAWLRPRRAERCATLAAPRALPVARQRPAWATLQDVYDSSRRARVFYNAVPSTPCDVCRVWASCARACGSAGARLAPGDEREPARPGARGRAPAAATLAPALLVAALTAALR